MDFRKIIKFGKASHIVSLPKSWLEKNKLKSGDLVYFEEIDKNILLTPRKLSKRKESLSIEIDISKLNQREINRRIVSAYIRDYNTLYIFGKQLSEKSKGIKEAIQNLMALEIVEETSERIVAKDFLKMDEISISDLMKRTDVITRAMFLDLLNLDKAMLDNIRERDLDVNRLTFLMFRATNYYLENPSFMSEKKISNRQLFIVNTVVRYLERIADGIKKIAKTLSSRSVTENEAKSLKDLLNQIYILYEKTMKAFYKEDGELALSLAQEKHLFLIELDRLSNSIKDKGYMNAIFERMGDIVVSCHTIGREVYD